eukprot:361367-Chlamydomonas_euryale.AAC.6
MEQWKRFSLCCAVTVSADTSSTPLWDLQWSRCLPVRSPLAYTYAHARQFSVRYSDQGVGLRSGGPQGSGKLALAREADLSCPLHGFEQKLPCPMMSHSLSASACAATALPTCVGGLSPCCPHVYKLGDLLPTFRQNWQAWPCKPGRFFTRSAQCTCWHNILGLADSDSGCVVDHSELVEQKLKHTGLQTGVILKIPGFYLARSTQYISHRDFQLPCGCVSLEDVRGKHAPAGAASPAQRRYDHQWRTNLQTSLMDLRLFCMSTRQLLAASVVLSLWAWGRLPGDVNAMATTGIPERAY